MIPRTLKTSAALAMSGKCPAGATLELTLRNGAEVLNFNAVVTGTSYTFSVAAGLIPAASYRAALVQTFKNSSVTLCTGPLVVTEG